MELIAKRVEFTPYHKAYKRLPEPERREFIAWDGEGQNLAGANRPQSYVLFGCSTGERILQETHIHTFDLLEFIIDIGRKNPGAFHVGFAFNYDVNMILRSLQEPVLAILHRRGHVMLRTDVARFHLQFRPGKWFSVTKYGPAYDAKKNPSDKVSVRIFDLFGFFTKSFIAAYTELVGPVPENVERGKADRDDFGNLPLEYIDQYWQTEIQMLKQLAEALRTRLYGAGLRITQWHGPGALASYALRQHNIKKAMKECPDPVREASRYGYAGGRFEIFKLGRIQGPIYSLDINSAYPFGITRLPDLTAGNWKRNTKPSVSALARFGIYRIRLNPTLGGTFLPTEPGPLPHRDKMGNISFPWILEGWYWSPEVRNLARLSPERYTILDGWEYVGSRRNGEALPFAWLQETYDKRLQWKLAGIPAQLALKLLMNSIYGKLAQRVGWDEDKKKGPATHQLEWAGWVTSHCRAMLWDVMAQIPFDKLIAVETDGIYTTMNPADLGIENSAELGGWEVQEYDEILYVQSGMAWLRKGQCADVECVHQDTRGKSIPGCAWACKRRGLDARTFALSDCQSYLRTLGPGDTPWEPYVGETNRFIGLGAALASKAPFKVRHCVWSREPREIRPGMHGKRIHIWRQCRACVEGLTAWEMAHDMTIRSLAYGDPRSHEHDIPWETDPPQYAWRNVDEGEVMT